MARPLRVDPEHGIHHVYSRGTRRWTLFIDSLDYQQFMQRLGVVCIRYEVKVYAYCLMGNHFHLVLYCPDAQLSPALRDLKSLYARIHNDRHGFSGPLFESRFGSKLVTSYAQLKGLVRYVHRNPLAIDASAPLESHPWSSHRFYLDHLWPTPEWLATEFALAFFADRAEYQRFVETNHDADKAKSARSSTSEPSSAPVALDRASLSAIVVAVAAVAKCDVSEVRPRMRNGLIGVVVLIASELARYTAPELSDACGFRSPRGVYNARRDTRRRLLFDDRLSAIHAKALDVVFGPR